MHALHALILLAACALGSACDKRPPTPQPPPGTEEQITGRERIGWDQQALDRAELATFRYAMYVDGSRTELTGVSCAASAGAAGFACDAGLPALPLGGHTLELAAFVVDGSTVAESPRSAPLRVNVISTLTVAASPAVAHRESPGSAVAQGVSPAPPQSPRADPIRLRIERVAQGLSDPTDSVFAPDGRLFIAERAGRIRIARNGRLNARDALALDDVCTEAGCGLVALALDPAFERTHYVYVLYTIASGSGDPLFRLARFREVNDTLAERAVLQDAAPGARGRAAGSLRFGPDRKLYVALDGAGDPARAADPASYTAKVLRFNADGSTPADQPAATPVYAYGYASPGGLDWQPATGALWLAGRDVQDVDRVRAVVGNEVRAIVGAPGASYAVGARANVTGVAFYRGDLFPALRGDLLVASAEGVMRIRFDPADPARPASLETLVQTLGVVRTLAIGPDGAIYACTKEDVFRLNPGR